MTAKASAIINHTKDLSLAKPIKKVNGRGSLTNSKKWPSTTE